MGRRKKKFSCGHVGFGSYCHRCAAEAEEKRKRRERKGAKKRTYDHLPISVDHIPVEQRDEVDSILAGLSGGIPPHKLGGRRMTTVNREVIVFNLGRHYRLVCVDKGAQITPYKVMSHETYNKQFSTFSSL